MKLLLLLSGLALGPSVHAQTAPAGPPPTCHFPGPAFPIPSMKHSDASIATLRKALDTLMSSAMANDTWAVDITSFSVQLTSAAEDLWSYHHTAEVNAPDADKTVDGDTVYRLASITKVFAVLSVMLESGKMHWDDPISKYIPELMHGNNEGGIEWSEITLHALGSQMSGLPRQFAYGDFAAPNSTLGVDVSSLGFPPVPNSGYPPCGTSDSDEPCSEKQLIEGIKKYSAVFNPSDRPTYSNTAYTLLGIAVSRVNKGKSWGQIISKNIFKPLDMANTGLVPPKSSKGAISVGPNEWNLDLGIENPAGGLYSSANDMTKFLRSFWSHKLLSRARTNGWLKPTSFNPGVGSMYGLPWEIARVNGLTPDGRTIDLYTKAGGMQGYATQLLIVPEYEIGAIILTTSDPTAAGAIQHVIGRAILGAMEKIVRAHTEKDYAGTYASPDLKRLNTSITLSSDPTGPGLRVTRWVSNSTDLLASVQTLYLGNRELEGEFYARASPTLVKKNGGDAWRVMFEIEGSPMQCITDIDLFRYARESATEFVFRKGGKMYLPAWRMELKRMGRR